MNRKQFIKLTSLSGIALAAIPHLAFGQNNMSISYEELIGKGNPELSGDDFKMRKEVYDAFMNMKAEANKSGISLKVVSSYRSFKHQNSIWERKFKSNASQGLTAENSIKKIIEYSTIPGTSRHHWGTDMDIVDANAKQPKSLLNPINFEENACFGKFKRWMDDNASHFGFYLVYTNDSNRKGFKYEPWHYSYKTLSCEFLLEYKKLKLKEILKKENLMGNEYFNELFLKNYWNEHILDINPQLL